MAGQHRFVVLGEAAADGLAQALSAAGFAIVAGRPQQQRWLVEAVDAGPYAMDADGFASIAAAGRLARRLARQHGGWWAGSGPCDAGRLDAVPAHPILLRRTGARPGIGQLPVVPPRSTRLSMHCPAPAGTSVDLRNLDDVPWTELEHAYGPAGDVPGLIRRLASAPDDWSDVLRELIGDELFHQGNCYSASVPAMRFLARLIMSDTLAVGRRHELWLDLLWAASRWEGSLVGSAERAVATGRQPVPQPWTAQVRAAVGAKLPRLLTRWPREPEAVRLVMAALAALFPEAAGPVTAEVAAMVDRHQDTQEGVLLALARAMIARDDVATLEAAAVVAGWSTEPQMPDTPGVTTAVTAGDILAGAAMRTPAPAYA
ncbi:hypothetical protein OHA72_10915 [Dactylosporangium sp. NBC_01737]|uniref:hypothetical protein n=1 Tax=Dactylosporangium sp. NBC_01737 TaxID=2975959 RepID=UPI002E11753E|nr:hypothetical protein OHA72_10915 [Dactylosporangium sp. NBC_01737]